MEQHGAGHGVQVQHCPDALGARLCVLDDVIGDAVGLVFVLYFYFSIRN